MSEQEIQNEQRKRYTNWVETEGGVERAVTEATYAEPAQQQRTKWLKENTHDVPLLITGHKDILEVGCSGGHQIIAVNGQAGVDNNHQIIFTNKDLYPNLTWKLADAQHLSFKDGEFHTVLLPEILEHLWFNEALQAVREAKRVAKSRILITIPDGRDPEKNKREVYCFKHKWVCTNTKLEELVCEANKNGWLSEVNIIGPFICVRMEKL